MPDLLGQPGGHGRRELQAYLKGSCAGHDAEVFPDIVFDRRCGNTGDGEGRRIDVSDTGENEIPETVFQRTVGDEMPGAHVMQEMEGQDVAGRGLVVVGGIVPDRQGAGIDEGVEDLVKDGLVGTAVFDILDGDLPAQGIEREGRRGSVKAENPVENLMEGVFQGAVGDGGCQAGRDKKGHHLVFFKP